MENNREAVEKLVQRTLEGDDKAFEELYRLTNQSTYFVALKITKNEDDALDILQDSYIKALQKLNQLSDPGSFSAWFNQIVANSAKNYICKSKPVLFEENEEGETVADTFEDDDSDFVPEESFDCEETRKAVMEIIDSLPEDKRLCILMFYYYNMKIGDIASDLGVPENTVKNRLFDGRKKIKQRIEELRKTGSTVLGTAPAIPLFKWLLGRTAKTVVASEKAAKAVLALIGSSSKIIACTSAEGTTATASTANIAGTAAKSGTGFIMKRIIIAAVAGAVVVSGAVAGVKVTKSKKSEMNTESPTMFNEIDNRVGGFPVVIDNIEYYVREKTARVIGYKGEVAKDLKIPKKIIVESNEKTVTEIGVSAFLDCSSLVSITIPDSVTTIECSAFYRCISLESVTISDSVTTIDEAAFYMCSSLQSVSIPNSVTSIGDSAFASCASLKSITIPGSVKTIGRHAFYGNECLESINVDDSNQNYSNDDAGVLFNKSGPILIQYPTGRKSDSYTVPSGTVEIADWSFYQSRIADIVLPNSVTTIGDYAFYMCKFHNKVNISASVKSIGTQCFIFERDFLGFNVDNDSLYFSNDEYGALFDKDKTKLLSFPCGLDSIDYEIPDSVTVIENNAFQNCDISSVLIPDSVRIINSEAFISCAMLNIKLSSSLTYIGKDAFKNADHILSVQYDGSPNDFVNGKIKVEEGNESLINAIKSSH